MAPCKQNLGSVTDRVRQMIAGFYLADIPSIDRTLTVRSIDRLLSRTVHFTEPNQYRTTKKFEIFLENLVASIRIFPISNSCFSIQF